MNLITILGEFGCILCGIFSMGSFWFIGDPYSRGFKDGYDVAKMEIEGETDGQN